jgi:hypothetical protein
MATKKKMLMSAAGSAGGAGLDITDVFSTSLYTGNGSAQTINNGIDLAGEGGLVWQKRRSSSDSHVLSDTVRGLGQVLQSDTTFQNQSLTSLFSYQALSNGFSFSTANSWLNTSGSEYASWTWRKAPKFLDIVTYTGNGTANRAISHNLGSSPGMVIIKRTSASENWVIWHRSLPSNKMLTFTTNATTGSTPTFDSSLMSSTTFGVNTDGSSNANGSTYVAYVFAHNDGDGEFGPDSDQDIIKCGSFTAGANVDVDIGFEPQWVLVRNSSGGHWIIHDSMRGFLALPGDSPYSRGLRANDATAERNSQIQVTSTGFATNANAELGFSGTCIYMAIRRGSLAPPESATEVFEPAITYDENNNPGFNSGFVTDMALYRQPQISDEFRFYSRLTQGKRLRFDSSIGESADTGVPFDFMDGVDAPTNANADGWLWKRAPNFFEVVAYKGNSTAGHTVSHNLGVAPEMMWVKKRNNTANWKVYHASNGNNYHMFLNLTSKGATGAGSWNNTTPTESVFTLGIQQDVNNSGDTFIACLFASLDGVSKCGGYTGNGAGEYLTGGSSQTIDCGFTSGARLILIKSTSIASNDWQLWDTTRGIVAGNDPHLSLNTTAAQVTSDDSVDANSSGFTVNQVAATNVNASGETYIYYAIA